MRELLPVIKRYLGNAALCGKLVGADGVGLAIVKHACATIVDIADGAIEEPAAD